MQQKATLKTLEPKEAKHAKISGPKASELPEIDDYERPELEKFEKPEFGKTEKAKKVSIVLHYLIGLKSIEISNTAIKSHKYE